MIQLVTLASPAADSSVAGPVVVAAICVGMTLFGLALILDVGSLRTRLVESRMKQNRDFPRLAKMLSEPKEADERRIQNLSLIVGGIALMGMAAWIFTIVRS
mgnify:CR=1 FL=1